MNQSEKPKPVCKDQRTASWQASAPNGIMACLCTNQHHGMSLHQLASWHASAPNAYKGLSDI